MAIYKIKLLDRKMVAKDTMLFTFEKPAGFTFKAGQWGDFTLTNPSETDDEGNVRGFSIASPPSSDKIMITTRLRSTAFKRVIQKTPIGTEITLDAPHGSFTLHHNQAIPAVFIAGGIGITPVRSILLQAIADKLSHKIYLFYFDHNSKTMAFLEELQILEKQSSNFKFIPITTSLEGPNTTWSGETGHINCKILSKYIVDLAAPIYYVSGPAAMVTAAHKELNECGIDDDLIRTEEFSGY
ncbi:MAG: FAD-dependent oxidoreductase [Verrucomicrobia bacterium]|nr:FAD-dependent oxidoreductase [Verrucomicrobiota bacterium]